MPDGLVPQSLLAFDGDRQLGLFVGGNMFTLSLASFWPVSYSDHVIQVFAENTPAELAVKFRGGKKTYSPRGFVIYLFTDVFCFSHLLSYSWVWI